MGSKDKTDRNAEIYVHPSAEISDDADIGSGSKIWNQAQIREDASIGTDCIISKNVYIDSGVHIGNRVKIQNNVNVYNGVFVEDDVFLGPSMTFTNDMYPRAFNKDWKVVPTYVRKGASIGAGAVIRCGVNIGEYSMVGAASLVTKDVKPYSLVTGNPAKFRGWVCVCGEKLDTELKCSECGRKYALSEGEYIHET
ncbi:MAG: N-acetyltransferase [Lachnospiraceae bacterium]|nr:N-acetyltransferase [Lachnospiraceae bacterium]